MRFSTTIFLFIAGCNLAFSQIVPVEWSEPERKSGQIVYLLPKDTAQFYALRWSGGRLLGNFQVSLHNQLVKKNHTRIKVVADKSIANFEGAGVFNGKFMIFLSDKKEDKNLFFMQSFDDNLKPEDDPIQLASYDLERTNKKGEFSIVLSENEQYMGIVWQIPNRKDGRDHYGFKVFDKELNVVNEGEYPLPFKSELSIIHSHHISGKGDYFMALSEFIEKKDRKLFEDRYEYKTLHIYHISGDGLQDYRLKMEGKQILEMAMTSDDDNIFTITGVYGEIDKLGASGVFVQRADVANSKIIGETFQEFSEDFITQGWTERDLRKSEKREERGRGNPKLYNYKMKGASIQEDGSIIGMMEQYYVQVRSFSDPASAQSSNSYYYYYNDIIAYKLNPKGEFDWIKKIPKFQVSSNDGGPYSSYQAFIDDSSAYFLFNDNSRNYDEEGIFIESDRVYAANFGRNRNIVAYVTLNLSSGQMERKSFYKGDEVQGLLIPKKIKVDNINRQVLLYTLWGNKERFGILKF